MPIIISRNPDKIEYIQLGKNLEFPKKEPINIPSRKKANWNIATAKGKTKKHEPIKL